MSHVDFSYGPVQILFDVSFEVRKGEVLALLGTNGAGSRRSCGSSPVSARRRGGRAAERADHHLRLARARTQLGIRMLPGGKGVFGDMTIRENLEMAAWIYRKDQADVERRIAQGARLFPELARAAR